MAGVNITNVGLTFTKYLKDVVETLNHTSKARTMTKNTDKWTGSHLEWRVHTGRSNAIGNVEDGGAFPVADYQKYVAAKACRKIIVGSIQLTDAAMATASGTENSARSVISSEVDGLMRDILKYENGMFFRDGTGVVATVKANYGGGAPTTVYVDDARMLWDGGQFELYDSTLATFRGHLTISKVQSAPVTNYALVTVTAGIAAMVAGDKIVWKGSLNRCITGLAKLIDNTATTFQNVPVGTYPRYSSLVLSNSSVARELSPTLFRQALAGIKQKCGNTRPSEGITVLASVWDAINVEELYEGELRLSPSDKVGGIEVAAFQSALGRISISDDADAPMGKMFFCDFSQIHRAVQKELDWRRDQGGSILMRSDAAGVRTATAMEISELYIKERGSSARIDDLSVSPVTMY
jgi:hypothetical protein